MGACQTRGGDQTSYSRMQSHTDTKHLRTDERVLSGETILSSGAATGAIASNVTSTTVQKTFTVRRPDAMENAFILQDLTRVDSSTHPRTSQANARNASIKNYIDKFYQATADHGPCDPDTLNALCMMIRSNLPPDVLTPTPWGDGSRKVLYADYTASGRPLRFIEEYMQRVVHPLYANTHTEISGTGLQSTHFREEARAIVGASLNADVAVNEIVFCGSGSTGALGKLAALLGVVVGARARELLGDVEVKDKTAVLISHMEHHSNELIWRESCLCDVYVVPADAQTGGSDLTKCAEILEKTSRMGYKSLLGSFSGGSNVTGLLNDVFGLAKLLHSYGGKINIDYAGSGPYVKIDMNPTCSKESYLDSVCLSPHKFVGGPGTPGVLCIRRDLVFGEGFDPCDTYKIPPTLPAGGTVVYVSPTRVGYEEALSLREEGGTPDVLGSIRLGLVFHLRNSIGIENIERLEGRFASRAVERWSRHPNIEIVGLKQHPQAMRSAKSRTSITSFNVRYAHDPSKYLHFHFVAKLLNDVYGIQARSGCSCAGPYGSRLFELTPEIEERSAMLARNGYNSIKLGWCRVNFNYFIRDCEFEFIVRAVEDIATHGHKLLPMYTMDKLTGQFTYNGSRPFNRFDVVRKIAEVELRGENVSWKEVQTCTTEKYREYVVEGEKIFEEVDVESDLHRIRDFRLRNCDPSEADAAEFESLRWFCLGSEVLRDEFKLKPFPTAATAIDDDDVGAAVWMETKM